MFGTDAAIVIAPAAATPIADPIAHYSCTLAAAVPNVAGPAKN